MNFGQVSELEQAAWPVFRVDKSRRICGVNKAAYERFGERLETLQLSGIWTAADQEAPWTALWNAQASSQKLKFLDKSNNEFEATVMVSRVTAEGQEQLLFQVVGSISPTPIRLATTPPQGVEINLAHKQKLDCALHLTRTVALD